MRRLGKGLAVLALLAGLAALTWHFTKRDIGMWMFDRAVQANVGRDLTADLPDGLHILLCGTGSPLPDPTRAGACVAVIAGDRLMLFDSGAGSSGVLARSGFPIGRLDALYLTHLHSDHFDGLGPIMLQSWVAEGRSAPLPFIGPAGIDEVAAGFNSAYLIDSGYRTAHHGADVADPAGFGLAPQVISLDGGDSQIVYDQDGITVTAFLVDHSPISPAFGYRIAYRGRSVVISGDTVASPVVARQAEGADLLIHEALNARMVGQIAQAAGQAGRDNVATVMADIPDYHTSPTDAAGIAQQAGVDMLVLTHIVPQLPSRLLYPAFLDGAENGFDGPIVIGEDGMLFSLPADSDAIERVSTTGR